MCIGAHDFIPAAGIINAQLIFDLHGNKVQNVFNIRSGAGVAVSDLDRIQAKLLSWLNTNWVAISANAASCSLMVLKDLTVEAGVGKEYALAPTVSGSLAFQAAPAHVTSAIKWGTGLIGRSHRGRTFHVGHVVTSMSGNALTGGAQAAIQANYALLITKLAAGGTVDKLCVVSYCHEGDWRSTAEVTDITGCSVDINIDSQRRRLNGRGT